MFKYSLEKDSGRNVEIKKFDTHVHAIGYAMLNDVQVVCLLNDAEDFIGVIYSEVENPRILIRLPHICVSADEQPIAIIGQGDYARPILPGPIGDPKGPPLE